MAPSASDYITYAGVPLAVIGVLPTLYVFFRSLITLRDIRRTLARNHISAITRPSTLAGLVEVELPRLSLAPLDRNDPLYFEVNRNRSELKGGSWTTLHWREIRVSTAFYRVQYHDELKQPQADINFEHLIAFLLDRGAVPDPCGWADLREAGMWTPAGTILLRSPSDQNNLAGEPVLRTATSEDSDGLLALVLDWREGWDLRTVNDLPPYWMRIKVPLDGKSLGIGQVTDKTLDEGDGEMKPERDEGQESSIVSGSDEKTLAASTYLSSTSAKRQSTNSNVNPFLTTGDSKEGHNRRQSAASFRSHKSNLSRHSHKVHLDKLPTSTPSLRLRLSPSGLSTLLTEPHQLPLHVPYVLPPHPIAPFFSAACSAIAHLPTEIDTGGSLWSYTSPAYLLSLSHTPSIPLGILSLLSFHTGDSWRSPEHLASLATAAETAELEMRQRQETRMRDMMNESRLPAAERGKAAMDRMMREMTERRFEQERQHLEQQRLSELEIQEAVSSRRVAVSAVAALCRSYLLAQELIGSAEDNSEIVERVLWECVRREEVADALGDMLTQWKGWVDGGGITREGYEMLKERKIEFCYAACLLALVGETAGSAAGNVGSDMQECLRLWKKVRLG